MLSTNNLMCFYERNIKIITMKNLIVFFLKRIGVFCLLPALAFNSFATQVEEKTTASGIITMDRLFGSSVYCRIIADIRLSNENNIEVTIKRGFYRIDNYPLDERRIRNQGHRLELMTAVFANISVTFDTRKIQWPMEVPPELTLTFHPSLEHLTESAYVKFFMNFNYYAFGSSKPGALELILKIEVEKEEPEKEIIVVEKLTDAVEPAKTAPGQRRVAQPPVSQISENTLALEKILTELNILYSKLFGKAALSAEEAGQFREELLNLRNAYVELTRQDEADEAFVIAIDDFRLVYDLTLELMSSFTGIQIDPEDMLSFGNNDDQKANANLKERNTSRTLRIMFFAVIGVIAIAFLIFRYFKKLKMLIKR